MILSLTIIALECQDVINFSLGADAILFFGATKYTIVGLQIFFGILLIYTFVVVFNSLSRVNLGIMIRIKSDKSTFLISILTSLVLYSYVSFPLYYNFADSIMWIHNSALTKNIGEMAFLDFPGIRTRYILPIMVAISFFFAYFEIIDKLLVWLLVKEHYATRFTKEGLKNSVQDFVSTFHKLSEELLDYHDTKRIPIVIDDDITIDNLEKKDGEAPLAADISKYES